MSKKPALTGRTLSYVTIEPSGSVTVDIEKFLKSDIGKARLVDLKKAGQKMRKRIAALRALIGETK
jgi:glycine cleavage system H lipoate-binding protein